MKKKRFVKTSLSLMLALTMVLGTVTTVFAQGEPQTENISGMDEAQESVETADTTTDTAIEAVETAETSVDNAGIVLVITEVTADGEETINLDTVEDNLTGATTDLSNTDAHLTDAEDKADEAKKIIDDANVESLSTEIENADIDLENADNASLQDKTDAEDGLDTVNNAATSTQAKPGLDKAEVAANDSETQVKEAEAALETINNDIKALNDAITAANQKKEEAEKALVDATEDATAAKEKLAAADEEIKKLQAELNKTIENRDKTRSDEIAILEKELKEHCDTWKDTWNLKWEKLSEDEKKEVNAFWNLYWDKMNKISKAYISKMLETDENIKDAEIRIDDNYTHFKDEKQNYIKVWITKDGETKEHYFNYRMAQQKSKDNFNITVFKKESREEIDETNVIKEERYVKMVEDPEDSSNLIESTPLAVEKIDNERTAGRVFETTDEDGNPVSVTLVGDEIAVPVKEKVTEDAAVKDYKGAKVDEASKVDTYTQGTANVFTGYGEPFRTEASDSSGFFTDETVEQLRTNYGSDKYDVKIEYWYRGRWKELKEEQGVEWYTSVVSLIGLGVRYTVKEKSAIYTEQNCIIKTTTGNVEEEVSPAESFTCNADYYTYGGIWGRSEQEAKRLAKADAERLASEFREKGYTVVVGEPQKYKYKKYYDCSITCTKDRVTIVHSGVVLSTEYFNPDTYEFKSREYGTKTVYYDGDEVTSTNDISEELEEAKKQVEAFEKAKTDIANAVKAVEDANAKVKEAKEKVEQLKLDRSATATEIQAAQTKLDAAEKLQEAREEALQDVKDNAAAADEAYRKALDRYNQLLAAEADDDDDDDDGGDDDTTPEDPTTPVAPVNPTTPETTVIPGTPVALAAAPAAANNAAVNAADDNDGNGEAVIEDEATPLTDNTEVTEKEDDSKEIADEATPLEAGTATGNSMMSWLWLIILIVLLVAGTTAVYIRSKRAKNTVEK